MRVTDKEVHYIGFVFSVVEDWRILYIGLAFSAVEVFFHREMSAQSETW
jgi:hypothetical protein